MSSTLDLTLDQYLEFEKIAIGSFSPLKGFMNEIEFHSVVETMRLPSGDVFSLPVILDLDEDKASEISQSNFVNLRYNSVIVGRIFPSDQFRCNRSEIALKVFGTNDVRHPGVKYFFGLRSVFIGGRVELVQKADCGLSSLELSPAETKSAFKSKNWERVVGFQTRNIPHRAHEYLQRTALESMDGLFIQPLIGKRKPGDFTADSIIKGYEILVNKFLPRDRVLLGTLSTVMRYAGPREAVFHAIIRRNYGCTHFIVGRDHAGVGDFYGIYDAHELTKRFDGDLGITVMRFRGPFYCSACGSIATDRTCGHSNSDLIRQISGTYVRDVLMQGKTPDPKLIRPEVVNALLGRKMFIEEYDDE